MPNDEGVSNDQMTDAGGEPGSDTRTAFRTCPLCEAGCGLETLDGQLGMLDRPLLTQEEN